MSDIPNKLGFCCLPVLPTIFSDELSYKEMLCKMKDYINQMIDALKQQDEDIANIQKQVDKVDPSKYIQTSGGTLTGPLFFLDQNSVVKNADGTFTVQSNNPLVIKTGQTAAVNATDGVEIRSGGTVLVTGNDGVSILDKSSAGVAVFEGNTAIAGNIEINGPTTFGNVDVDMLNARTKVAEPVEDANPATKKYVDAHEGVTCGYITVAVDDAKTTVDVHSENLIPKGVLGGYYVDNAGNLWHATQVVTGGFTLENKSINVLANAEFVRTTGSTSVKNINVNDTGSSTYQATTNVLVQGGAHVDISAGSGVEILASENGAVNIEGGAVAITGDINIHGPTTFDKENVDMHNAMSVMVPTPVKDSEAATKLYVDQHSSSGGAAMKQFDISNGMPMIPIADIPSSGSTTFHISLTIGHNVDNQIPMGHATGVITTANRSITDVKILSIGYDNNTDAVVCRWVDSGLITMTTDGIQIDVSATMAGYSGWYAKIS